MEFKDDYNTLNLVGPKGHNETHSSLFWSVCIHEHNTDLHWHSCNHTQCCLNCDQYLQVIFSQSTDQSGFPMTTLDVCPSSAIKLTKKYKVIFITVQLHAIWKTKMFLTCHIAQQYQLYMCLLFTVLHFASASSNFPFSNCFSSPGVVSSRAGHRTLTWGKAHC